MNKNTHLTGFEIAIIGMDGRFPGARNIDEFWDNLKNGVESIFFFSDEEVLETGVDQRLLKSRRYVKAHGYLEDIEYFDSSFFDYSPREAANMDPQVRIFHECAWKALEDAGYTPGTYNGLIGMYGGAAPNINWEVLTALSGAALNTGDWAATQLSDKDFLCTRVSYKLNLKGPSLSLNTACSTSLVAVHQACQAILNGECHMALVGGVSVSTLGKNGYLYQEGMIFSQDGHVRAFDAGPHGIVGGSGGAVVVLKRLEDAIADRDFIYAVIKGSAVNNDGLQKAGYTAPGIEGQARAIRAAQLMAEVEPESIGYIETHGTATELGDPVEIEALKLAFNTDKRKFCPIGSVKTNVGHLGEAAGITGLIKTALAIKNRVIPPSLNFSKPNPKINFKKSPFYVNTKLLPWENGTFPRRAGVSSFGIGGTNAHVILEEFPPPQPSSTDRKFHLILLSAKTPNALEKNTHNLGSLLKKNPDLNLADTAYTLQVGRKALPFRRALVCSTLSEAARYLSSPEEEILAPHVVNGNNPNLVFMFSGQGSQYVNMGRDLYENEPTFRTKMDRGFHILESLSNINFKDIIYPDLQPGDESAKEKINNVLYSGPVKLLFEYSVAKLLMKWGIKPCAAIGHSFGEYTAACFAEVFSLDDALKISLVRGQLMERTLDGAMTSVPLSEEKLESLLDSELSIAAVNAPELCIVSGAGNSIRQLEKHLEKMGNECLRINFPRASHSKLMVPILKEFVTQFTKIKLNKPKIPYISGLFGKWITEEQAADPNYWAKHMTNTIRFADGIETLIKELNPIFIQLSSDQGLPLFVKQHPLKKDENLTINIIQHPKEKKPDEAYLLTQMGQLWLSGVNIDWGAFYNGEKRNRIPLPTYSFEQIPYPSRGNVFQIFNRLFSQQTTSVSTPGEENFSQTLIEHFADFKNIPGNPNASVKSDIDNKPSASSKQKRPPLATKYAPPGNELEKAVVEIFEQFFGIEPVGIDDDFYELGGDSLKSIQLAALLRKNNLNITFRQILMHRNVHEICQQDIENGEVKPVKEVGMDMGSIESSLAKKYNTNVHYRTYQVKNQSIRILFLEGKPFERHLVLESMNHKKNPSSIIYPNYIAFTGPGTNGSNGNGNGNQIPKQENIDEASLTTLLGLNKRVSFKDRARMMRELRKNNQLSRLLKMNTKASKYEASPVQKFQLASSNKLISSQLIYYYHDFSYPTDITKIKEVIAALIQRNSLLRSVIVNIDGNYFVEEFDSFSNAPLPFVDISHYPPSSQKKLENIMVRQLKRPMKVLDNVLFRLVVLKKDHSHYKLIILFNHLIFDGFSVGILKQQMDNLNREPVAPQNRQVEKTSKNHYNYYVDFLTTRSYENIQLEKYLDLADYNRSIKKIAGNYTVKELKYEDFELDISMINERFKEYYNEIVLLVFARIIGHLFNIEKAPISFTSHGRIYKEADFNHIIGDFHDIIPVLFPLNGNQARDVMHNFIEYKRFIKENNLNFFNYMNKRYTIGNGSPKLTSPFTFNAIVGSYDYFKRTGNKEMAQRAKTNGISVPYFHMAMLEDFYTNKLWISFLQNSGLNMKEIFMKKYRDLVHELSKSQIQTDKENGQDIKDPTKGIEIFNHRVENNRPHIVVSTGEMVARGQR